MLIAEPPHPRSSGPFQPHQRLSLRAAECGGPIDHDPESLMYEVGVEDGSASRDFILAGSLGVDVLGQLGQNPRESVCARDISGYIFLVDDGTPARALTQ